MAGGRNGAIRDDAPARHVDLWLARGVTLGAVVLAFPASAFAVFAVGIDRDATADALAVVYAFGLFAAFTTSLWPLPSLRAWSRFDRIQSMCLLFLIVSYLTHLTWELGWLVLRESIQSSRDAVWAYPWWAYIDGGDTRYAGSSPTLLMMETLSVLNGAIGAFGLYLWYRSRGSDERGVLLCMATAVVHLYSASLYFGAEILAGLPSVDTSSFVDGWIKFGLANAPWVVFPWFVLYWGSCVLVRRSGASQGAGRDAEARTARR